MVPTRTEPIIDTEDTDLLGAKSKVETSGIKAGGEPLCQSVRLAAQEK